MVGDGELAVRHFAVECIEIENDGLDGHNRCGHIGLKDKTDRDRVLVVEARWNDGPLVGHEHARHEEFNVESRGADIDALLRAAMLRRNRAQCVIAFWNTSELNTTIGIDQPARDHHIGARNEQFDGRSWICRWCGVEAELIGATNLDRRCRVGRCIEGRGDANSEAIVALISHGKERVRRVWPNDKILGGCEAHRDHRRSARRERRERLWSDQLCERRRGDEYDERTARDWSCVRHRHIHEVDITDKHVTVDRRWVCHENWKRLDREDADLENLRCGLGSGEREAHRCAFGYLRHTHRVIDEACLVGSERRRAE